MFTMVSHITVYLYFFDSKNSLNFDSSSNQKTGQKKIYLTQINNIFMSCSFSGFSITVTNKDRQHIFHINIMISCNSIVWTHNLVFQLLFQCRKCIKYSKSSQITMTISSVGVVLVSWTKGRHKRALSLSIPGIPWMWPQGNEESGDKRRGLECRGLKEKPGKKREFPKT